MIVRIYRLRWSIVSENSQRKARKPERNLDRRFAAILIGLFSGLHAGLQPGCNRIGVNVYATKDKNAQGKRRSGSRETRRIHGQHLSSRANAQNLQNRP
jgi:hypothetical protein